VKRVGIALTSVILALTGASADARADAFSVDRAVVRFIAPETGGVRSPRFVYERMLAFESRIEAFSDPDRGASDSARPYRERHIRAALERHIAESLLAGLRIEPEPTERELARQTESARRILFERMGGVKPLEESAKAEGIDSREITSMLRRQARASLYLDRMVAPMLNPSNAELKNIHSMVQTPFRNQPFDRIEPALRRWYIARRLSLALQAFFQGARSRVTIELLVR
jgi:hypothetical protein